MTTLVTGAGRLCWQPRDTRNCGVRGAKVRVLPPPRRVTNRAIADLSLREYVTGDLREPASLDRAMKGSSASFTLRASYRLWARSSQEIYDFEPLGGTKKPSESGEARWRRTVSSTQQHGGNRCPSTRAAASEMNSHRAAKLEEMRGATNKRSKWMAEREALEAAKNGLPVIVAMPTTPVGPGDWKPTPTGKINSGFLNGKMPGYVETGLILLACECARGQPAGRRKRQSWRALPCSW